jgi:hypothetical protein
MSSQTAPKRAWWKSFINDDEKRIFVGKDGTNGLVRSKFVWRSMEALASEAGLSKAKTEQILDKYVKRQEIYIKAGKDGQLYAYWERGDTEIQKKPTSDEQIKDDQSSRAAAAPSNTKP